MLAFRRFHCAFATAVALPLVLFAKPSVATYSLLVANQNTGEIGGGAVSCVGDFDLEAIFGFVPNVAPELGGVAFFTQGLYSEALHDQVAAWLRAARTPDAILGDLQRVAFDPDAQERQYHFLPQVGPGLTWTGNATQYFASGRAGVVGSMQYTIAGNILTGSGVLDGVETALRTNAVNLEDLVLTALEGGAAEQQGDSRCSPLPGDSAHLVVLSHDGQVRSRVSAVDTGAEDPLALLRRMVLPQLGSPPTVNDAPSVSPNIPETSVATTTTDSSRDGCSLLGRRTGLAPSAWCSVAGVLGWLGRRRLARARASRSCSTG